MQQGPPQPQEGGNKLPGFRSGEELTMATLRAVHSLQQHIHHHQVRARAAAGHGRSGDGRIDRDIGWGGGG